MTKKKTNATDAEKLHNLTNADWKFLNKMLCKHSESIVNTVNDFTCETYDSLFNRLVLIEFLLHSLFEMQGKNPIDECEMLRLHYVYNHNSVVSDVPGMRIKSGKLFDRDGKEIPMDYVYQAKEKGIEFHKVISEYYKNIDNDETNEESSKSDDEEHRSSQALEA